MCMHPTTTRARKGSVITISYNTIPKTKFAIHAVLEVRSKITRAPQQGQGARARQGVSSSPRARAHVAADVQGPSRLDPRGSLRLLSH